MDLIEWVEGVHTDTVLTTLGQEIVFGVEVAEKNEVKRNPPSFSESLDPERNAVRVLVDPFKDVISRIHIYY